MRRRATWIAVIAVGFWSFAAALLTQAPWHEEGTTPVLPLLPAAAAVTVLGPPGLLLGGIGAWKWAAGILALIAVCLGLARFAYQRSPQTEWFAAWLAAAVLLWAGSGWLLAVFAW